MRSRRQATGGSGRAVYWLKLAAIAGATLLVLHLLGDAILPARTLPPKLVPAHELAPQLRGGGVDTQAPPPQLQQQEAQQQPQEQQQQPQQQQEQQTQQQQEQQPQQPQEQQQPQQQQDQQPQQQQEQQPQQQQHQLEQQQQQQVTDDDDDDENSQASETGTHKGAAPGGLWLPEGYNPAAGGAGATCEDVQTWLKRGLAGKQDPAQPSPFLDYYFQCIYKPMVIDGSKKLQVVVWRRDGTFGFGNQLRGQYGAFLFALVTGRVFAIDDKMFDFYFNDPPGMTWKYNSIMKNNPKPRVKRIKQKGKHTDTDFVGMRFSKWAKDYDVVALTVFSNIESYMVDNPEMARWMRKLFGTESQHVRITQCLNWMLQSPSKAFLKGVQKTKERIGLPDDFIAVQFRSFKHGKYFDAFKAAHLDGSMYDRLDCLIQRWKADNPGKAVPKHIFFTTDKPKVFTPQSVSKHLRKYGKVVLNAGGYEPSGKMGARAWRQVSQALVDWYLLGQASPSIVGGTSYGNTANGRTGYTHGMYFISHEVPCQRSTRPLLDVDPMKNHPV